MNVDVHQKEENRNAGKKELGEEKRQTTNFKETECCPYVAV